MIAGLLLLLGLLIGIVLFWFRFSTTWNKQVKLAKFLDKNPTALIERDVPIQANSSINYKDGGVILTWEVCDLFIFPEGLILRGRKNSEGFYDCLFLYTKNPSRSILKTARVVGSYERPIIIKNILRYELNLIETWVTYFGGLHIEMDLFPNEKTIEILRKNNLL